MSALTTPLNFRPVLSSNKPGPEKLKIKNKPGIKLQRKKNKTAKIRIGIIGAGEMASRLHIPWIKAARNAEIAALCRRDAAKAFSLAIKHGIRAVYTDYRDLLSEKSIDAVIIATPNSLHCVQAAAAARAGKHIFIEKPMALSVAELETIIREAEKCRVILMAGHPLRFDRGIIKVKQAVDSGIIGRVLSMRGRLGHAGPEKWSAAAKWYFDSKQGGGCLPDLGIHIFDAMRFVSRKDASSVYCLTKTNMKKALVDDNAAAVVEFTDGTSGSFDVSWTAVPQELSLSVYGDKGSIFFNAGTREVKVELVNAKTGKFRLIKPRIPAAGRSDNPLAHFIECVRENKRPLIDGREAFNSTALIIAALQSAETGRRQAVHGLRKKRKACSR